MRLPFTEIIIGPLPPTLITSIHSPGTSPMAVNRSQRPLPASILTTREKLPTLAIDKGIATTERGRKGAFAEYPEVDSVIAL